MISFVQGICVGRRARDMFQVFCWRIKCANRFFVVVIWATIGRSSSGLVTHATDSVLNIHKTRDIVLFLRLNIRQRHFLVLWHLALGSNRNGFYSIAQIGKNPEAIDFGAIHVHNLINNSLLQTTTHPTEILEMFFFPSFISPFADQLPKTNAQFIFCLNQCWSNVLVHKSQPHLRVRFVSFRFHFV